MQHNHSRTATSRSGATATPGPSRAASGARTATATTCMQASDVLRLPLAHLPAHISPTLRIDWENRKLAVEFDFSGQQSDAGTVQCVQSLCGISDGAAHSLLASANRSQACCAVEGCLRPRPCKIHAARPARESAPSPQPAGRVAAPRIAPPIPRRKAARIVDANGPSGGATLDDTNTLRASNGDDASPAKTRTAAATFEPVMKAEPTDKIPGRRLHPQRRQFKIRNENRHTRWYRTTHAKPIDGPPGHLLKPPHGALYVHQYKVPHVGWQIWMFVKYDAETTARDGESRRASVQDGGVEASVNGSRDSDGVQGRERERERGHGGEWVRVYPGQPHPELEGYVLHMLDGGEPRWVKALSARQYASTRSKRVQVVDAAE
ncbi:hypothetical protein BD310DRAFT_582551 [Dichomitus squalens]|uniref:Uncharacterized protein n=1 Tax=Dichomitus squalens TaxID=114155 RepID=A0A4Q9Q7T2_9APHY|nr:hypothetical protein BD310DRAFT_582551 [Dichomitus squalens]